MNKRKILMMALSLCMVAILAVGGTLAYFTDEDNADNVFTMGNIAIELEENYEQESDLQPGLDVTKEAWIENTGSSDAYVRMHIAIPSEMDDGNPNFNAVNNFLHFNFTGESVAEGKWNWSTSAATANYPATDAASVWNFYTQEIDDVNYNVYVVTHEAALPSGWRTDNAITNVYLDKSVDCEVFHNEDGSIAYTVYTDSHGNEVTLTPDEAANIQIKIWAEATQTQTFTDAYDALNTAFGVPGTYNPWTAE